MYMYHVCMIVNFTHVYGRTHEVWSVKVYKPNYMLHNMKIVNKVTPQ